MDGARPRAPSVDWRIAAAAGMLVVSVVGFYWRHYVRGIDAELLRQDTEIKGLRERMRKAEVDLAAIKAARMAPPPAARLPDLRRQPPAERQY